MSQQPITEPIPAIEAFVARIGPRILYRRADRALYYPHEDYIAISPPVCYTDRRSYYCTLFHELAHWTGHRKRLNRQFGVDYADPLFAAEEITAITAEMHLGTAFGIGRTAEQEGTAYAQRWLPLIRNDPVLLARAVYEGQRAVRYLHRLYGGLFGSVTGALYRNINLIAGAHFSFQDE